MYAELMEATGSLRTTLRTITWTAVVIGGLGLIGGIIGLSTVERLGPVDENPWAGFGLACLLVGVFLPIALTFTHMAVKAWTGPDGTWHRGTRGLTFRILASLAYSLVGAGFGIFGLFPFVLLLPDQGEGLWEVVPVAIVGLILVGILVAAVAGAWALAGWIGIPVGIVFGLGFTGAAIGEFFEIPWVGLAGWGALVVSGLGFFALRAHGKRARV